MGFGLLKQTSTLAADAADFASNATIRFEPPHEQLRDPAKNSTLV